MRNWKKIQGNSKELLSREICIQIKEEFQNMFMNDSTLDYSRAFYLRSNGEFMRPMHFFKDHTRF